MKKADQIVREGEHYLLALVATYHKCWGAACRYDGLDPDTCFACFSSDNPYVPYLNSLFQQYQENWAALTVWGYVGLRITRRQ